MLSVTFDDQSLSSLVQYNKKHIVVQGEIRIYQKIRHYRMYKQNETTKYTK